jgi:hypothetical protein
MASMKEAQIDTVRDALGLVRLLYVAAHRSGDEPRAAALGLLGREFSDCYALMSKCGPGSTPYGRSVGRAEAALTRLAEVPGIDAPLVAAARARLTGAGEEA